MHDFKLVVVSPFKNFRRGSEINDPVMVENILDKNNPLHSFSNHCRRVKLKPIERQQYIPPSQPAAPNPPVDEMPPVSEPEVEPAPLPPMDAPEVEADMELKDSNDLNAENELSISSVKDDADEMAARPAKNQRRKK